MLKTAAYWLDPANIRLTVLEVLRLHNGRARFELRAGCAMGRVTLATKVGPTEHPRSVIARALRAAADEFDRFTVATFKSDLVNWSRNQDTTGMPGIENRLLQAAAKADLTTLFPAEFPPEAPKAPARKKVVRKTARRR
jgi:hypothetical protein